MSSELDLSKKLASVLQECSFKVQQDFTVKMKEQTPKGKKLDELVQCELDMRSSSGKEPKEKHKC